MGTTEEIGRMQQEGLSDQEIIQALQQQGISNQEISAALTESRIKEAVISPNLENDEMIPSIMSESQIPQAGIGEQLSISQQEQAPAQEQQYSPQGQSYPSYEQYTPSPDNQYPQYSSQDYNQYPVYQPSGLSPETITEIAEQVIQEKLEDTRDKLQQIATFKTKIEVSVESIDNRLKRIEQIIDRLQLSVLQKVGDYVNNVNDIKQELVETQKSFKSILPQLKK